MSGWNEAHDPEGRTYYYHAETGETTWDKPSELYTELEQQLDKHGWKAGETEEGQIYYYNQETGQSSWEVPTFPESTESQLEVPAPVSVPAPANDDVVTETATSTKTETLDTTIQDASASKNVESYPLQSKLIESATKSRTDAERAFLQMLADHQIDSTWSFNRIISELSCSDPRYWCVDDDPLWKRKMFEQYLANRSEDQLLKEHSAVNKFKDAFRTMLEQNSKIHFYTRWTTAKRLFANEPIYKHSVVSEKTKRTVFQEYVDDLRKEHFGNVEKTRQRALSELQDYLNAIIPNKEQLIPWQELSSKYLFENSTRFTSNRHFQTLSKHDVLKQYVAMVETFSKQIMDEIERTKAANYTADRKARDRFRHLLSEHSKLIRCNSKWEDVYPLIKSEPRFKALLGRNGSSALDLFLDVVEEKALVMNAHHSVASQILVDNNYEWDADREINTKKLNELLRVHAHLLEIDDPDREILISKLLTERDQKLARQAEMEHRLLEQRKNYFNFLLQRVFSEARPKPASFDEAQEQLKNYAEYKDLADEETKRRLFEAFEPSKTASQLVGSTGTPNAPPPASKLPRKRQMTPVELDY
ncbi:LAME_0E00716g1_1 [Lachancea meyersii CBS 8951]|uniref:LAME_0E00716g1_1 n=1 Tax=Lachancea meyersii CBS 8951 TaxID=1266667 RepID=A0A1G4JEN7_9SACH|nr:LAME_0E00716g1_1 [Lachancea meyersii CBS 8951]